ncbi:hypothetical protein BSZ21_23125 [Bradyrhizobium canariense]|nr:hypothetical protein BSZ21_23125 [Bradyrhizobium canariense]
MKGYWDHLEALRKQAAEAALISALATSPQKRALFAKIAEHLNTLAAAVEEALTAGFVVDGGQTHKVRSGAVPPVSKLSNTFGC